MINKRAQSIIEYVGLIVIISLALSAMSVYIRREVDVRMRHLAQELNETNR